MQNADSCLSCFKKLLWERRMLKMYDKISSPVDYGGIQLKNRIIFAPTTMGLKKDEYLKKLQKIACGGCAMIIIGDVPVGEGRLWPKPFHRQRTGILPDTDRNYPPGRLPCLCTITPIRFQFPFNDQIHPRSASKKISMEQLRPLLNKEVGPYISEMP